MKMNEKRRVAPCSSNKASGKTVQTTTYEKGGRPGAVQGSHQRINHDVTKVRKVNETYSYNKQASSGVTQRER